MNFFFYINKPKLNLNLSQNSRLRLFSLVFSCLCCIIIEMKHILIYPFRILICHSFFFFPCKFINYSFSSHSPFLLFSCFACFLSSLIDSNECGSLLLLLKYYDSALAGMACYPEVKVKRKLFSSGRKSVSLRQQVKAKEEL